MNKNIYQHIDANKRATFFVMFGFVLFISMLGWFIGEFTGEGTGLFFLGLGLIISGVSGFVSYYYSDKIVLGISGAKQVTSAEAPQLHALVENMSIASGIPMPKIYVIEDTALNAFATGRDPEHGVICFTTGIVNTLEKRELEGVVAHEMSHIGNYDIRLMSIVSVLVGTITLVSDWVMRGTLYGGRRDRREVSGILLIIGIAMLILSPIIGMLIQLAISRNREYLADSTAAMITRYPAGLAGALRKLSQDREILEAANGATAHLYIHSPLTAQGVKSFFGNLFNTHPPIEERIKRLENM